jgi:hypothetical protein
VNAERVRDDLIVIRSLNCRLEVISQVMDLQQIAALQPR